MPMPQNASENLSCQGFQFLIALLPLKYNQLPAKAVR
jgi:hypothetical protein